VPDIRTPVLGTLSAELQNCFVRNLGSRVDNHEHQFQRKAQGTGLPKVRDGAEGVQVQQGRGTGQGGAERDMGRPRGLKECAGWADLGEQGPLRVREKIRALIEKSLMIMRPPLSMSIEFKVQGKPPKKDGANSMWKKVSEVENLINLRQAARRARNSSGPFTGKIGIEVTIYAPEKEIESIGDLDNFVTGICDGLQAADPSAKMQEAILDACNPYEPLLFYSDARVYEILAKKTPYEGEKYYTLKVREIK